MLLPGTQPHWFCPLFLPPACEKKSKCTAGWCMMLSREKCLHEFCHVVFFFFFFVCFWCSGLKSGPRIGWTSASPHSCTPVIIRCFWESRATEEKWQDHLHTPGSFCFVLERGSHCISHARLKLVGYTVRALASWVLALQMSGTKLFFFWNYRPRFWKISSVPSQHQTHQSQTFWQMTLSLEQQFWAAVTLGFPIPFSAKAILSNFVNF